MTQTKTFLKHIAYLQIIGIMLVVLGHSFHEYSDTPTNMLLYRMMHSFRMPLFIFVSGYLMAFTWMLPRHADESWTGFAANKTKRLLLPFCAVLALTYVPRCLLSGYADDGFELSAKSFLLNFLYMDSMVIPFYWFLQASFILLTFNNLLVRLIRRACAGTKMSAERVDAVAFGAAFLTSLAFYLARESAPLFLSIDKVCFLGIFFTAGMACCRFGFASRFRNILRRPLTFGAVAAAWAILFFILEGSSWMPLCSAMGIIMCFSVAIILEDRDWRLLDPLIGSTYLIFLLSWFFNIASQQVFHAFTDFPWPVYTFLSFTTAIAGPWLIYRWLGAHSDNRIAGAIATMLGQTFRHRSAEKAPDMAVSVH